MTVGEIIKEQRVELGMTQDELACKLGYSGKGAISNIENGKENLTINRLEKIAKVLDVNPAYLAGWSNNPDTCKKLSKDELYELYNRLTERDQDLIVSIMRRLTNLWR